MDKLAKKAPGIRSHALKAPIVFAPNVQTIHRKSWPDSFGFYSPFMDSLLSQGNTKQVLFMPNIVPPSATIEERAKSLAKNLEAN